MERKFKHKITNKVIKIGGKTGLSCQTLIGNSDLILGDIIKGEDWEEIIEKDYEILSIQCIVSNFGNYILTKGSNGKFKNEYKEIEFDPNYYKIHSVRRKSDGEIFTIGDLIGTPGSVYPLREFKIIDSENTIAVHYYKDKMDGSGHYNYRLKNLKKVKQPLFTTEDGIDIFKGDEYYYINSKFSDPWGIINTKADYPEIINKNDLNYKRFSTKEAAEEYILYNKPLLTLKDVEELLCKNTSSYFLEKFKKRTQKLNK